MPRSSRFGIDRNKSAFLQLLKVLGIPATPARFGYLRTAFKALEQEYLDVALPPSAQNTALDKIRAKLEKEFPDLFDKDDKEKKLYLAVQAVCEILYAKRRRNASLGKNRDPNFIDLSDVKSDSDGSDEVIVVSTTRSRMALSEAVIQPPEQSSRHAVIRHFLERCEPPMDRFFTAFINFGCTTDQYLRSIAVFTPKIRNTTLRRMLSTYVGEVGPTEMDIAILDDYFISYFS